MLTGVKRLLRPLFLRPATKTALLPTVKELNAGLRALVARTHAFQLWLEWRFPPQPEWYDHYENLAYHWHASQNPLWVERGVFNVLALRDGGRVLSLCCGDGFHLYHFYAIRSAEIVGVDFDPAAIAHARRRNRASNIRYEVGDVRQSLPDGPFDTVIWDAAIEHFTPEEIAAVLTQAKERLVPGGILAGYTITERAGGKQLCHHEYEFLSKEDLARFLTPHFRNVRVFETIYPNRHNLYFTASDGILPFDEDWSPQVHLEAEPRRPSFSPTRS